MSKADSRFLRIWWPTLYDANSVKSAVHGGAWYALIRGGADILVTTLNLAGITNNILGLDARAYWEAGVWIILGVLIFRYSRVAAILALTLYLGEMAMAVAAGGSPAGILTMIVLGLFFVNSVRGTFAYRRLRRGRVLDEISVVAPN